MKFKVGDKVKCIDCSPWGVDTLSPSKIYTMLFVSFDGDNCLVNNDPSEKRWSCARFKLVSNRKQKLKLP